ncbi:hypothetical protein IFU29_21965, partial [Erwinia persicina]|nr:hypothetical protein [Erwinia persicina]
MAIVSAQNQSDFDREKEQNRLKQAQLTGEIGGQAMDVIRTQGDIAGLKAQTDPAALASGASPYLATEIRKLTTNPLTGKVDVASNA